jgi:hypothetical protein
MNWIFKYFFFTVCIHTLFSHTSPLVGKVITWTSKKKRKKKKKRENSSPTTTIGWYRHPKVDHFD